MPFIENISKQDCELGLHFDPTQAKTVCIQISDYEDDFCTPKYKEAFKAIYQFKFDDTEDVFDLNCITALQAKQIAAILHECLEQGVNVVVHCHAGICRSGAVVACAEAIGFDECERFKLPNALVKRKIMQELGYSITPTSSMFNQVKE